MLTSNINAYAPLATTNQSHHQTPDRDPSINPEVKPSKNPHAEMVTSVPILAFNATRWIFDSQKYNAIRDAMTLFCYEYER